MNATMTNTQLFHSPAEITQMYSVMGATKTKKPTEKLFLLAMIAGVIIGLGSAATNTAVYGVADTWTLRTICGLLFPFGLGMVLLVGAELFTGNCLIVISLLDQRCGVRGMLRNWTLVYLGNFAGAALVAAGLALFGGLDYSGGALAVYTIKVAAAKCAYPFSKMLVMGVFCNFLVSMAVIISLAGRDVTGRMVAMFMPVCFFVICGFEHCVANMYYISAGLLAKSVPAYAQLAAEAGVDFSALTVGNFLVGNLVPVTIGNILGGAVLGVMMWYCYREKPLH